MYEYCGNPQALDVARGFADWVKTRTDRLSDDQMQAMLGNEHGGMNEALANLYALTGDDRYLKLAQRFNHMAVLGPASQRRDTLTGLHANTQIPKFIGDGPAIRAHRRGMAADRIAVLLEHGRQGAVLRHRRPQRRRDVLSQGEALPGFGPEHDRDLQYLQHAQADAAPFRVGPARRVRRLL